MLQKIVSGGQTGVDRAALDAARACALPHGGWCPKGRLAEDGVIPPCYKLLETGSRDYAVRTERNVVDSDATLIFVRQRPLKGGTALTAVLLRRHDRPFLVLLESDGEESAVKALQAFQAKHQVTVLNVAGPRESQAPGLGQFARKVLERWLREAQPSKVQG